MVISTESLNTESLNTKIDVNNGSLDPSKKIANLKSQYLGSESGESAKKAPKDIIYSQQVPEPPPPTFTNFFSIITNIQDTGKYLQGLLIKGKDCKGNSVKMGNSFFIPSGKCDRYKSVPECRNRTRYMYINNVPQEYIPCSDPNIPSDPICKQNNPTGLIPGVIQDVVNINPFEIMASAVGEGSIVNDKCVLRTEKVGTQIGNKISFNYETRCAPAPRPLVCSIPMNVMPNCLQYDIDSDALRDSDNSDVPDNVTSPKPGEYVSEYTNKNFNTLIQEFIESKIDLSKFNPPQQLKKLHLDKYDSIWRTICSNVFNRFSIFLQKQNVNAEKFILKSCCMIDKIQCSNNYILYNWGTILYRNNRQYGFQLQWKAYYNTSDDTLSTYGCKIIGNPLPYEVDPDEGDFYNQIEGFTNIKNKKKNNYILLIIIVIFIIIFIIKIIKK